MVRNCVQRVSWAALVACAICLVIPGTALADDDEQSESYQEMLRFSAEGNQHYEAGRFDEAADSYARAYDAYPQPVLLKNQMVTRYLIEECEEAIELGQAFLDTGEGSDEDREDVEAVFGDCALDLAEEARDDGQWTDVGRWLEFGEPYFETGSQEEEANVLRAELMENLDEDTQQVEPIDEPSVQTTTIAGWSLVAGGVATVTTAAIWHGSFQSDYRDLDAMRDQVESGDVERSEFDERYATARWAVPTLYGVGAVAALAGAGLLIMPMLDGGDEGPAASLQPVLGVDGAGAVFTLSF